MAEFIEPLDFWMRPTVERKRMGSNMAAIARALNRALPDPLEVETLKQLALLAGAGLLVSLVLMTWGLDLSPGFF
jgi:hypothetical protein